MGTSVTSRCLQLATARRTSPATRPAQIARPDKTTSGTSRPMVRGFAAPAWSQAGVSATAGTASRHDDERARGAPRPAAPVRGRAGAAAHGIGERDRHRRAVLQPPAHRDRAGEPLLGHGGRDQGRCGRTAETVSSAGERSGLAGTGAYPPMPNSA
jgi:hypothetical protein